MNEIALLFDNDAAFLHRSLLELLTVRVRDLFAKFSASPYASQSHCPVKPFTHFYLTPPELTHARGTARYVWHFLTNKDDSQCKRSPYSLKRVADARAKFECCVSS